MKHLFILLIAFFYCGSILAQDEVVSSQYILGGSLNFYTQKNAVPFYVRSALGNQYLINYDRPSSKTTAFSIAPKIGKQITIRTLVGLQLRYQATHYEAKDVIVFSQPAGGLDLTQNTNSYSVGIFSRHTLNPENKLSVYLKPSIHYNSQTDKLEYDDRLQSTDKTTYIDANIDLGFLYQISRICRAQLHLGGLSYINGSMKNNAQNEKIEFSQFGLNVNSSTLFFGFEFLL